MGPPIAIVGGGPCGLTFARLLECKGIDYVVYEKEEIDAPGRGGGTLDIHKETGQRALQEAKLFDDFLKVARMEDDVFSLYDKHGKKHAEFAGDGERPEIDRRDLQQLLLSSIPKEKIQWKTKLKSVSRGEGGRLALEFADGTTQAGYSLVVGADGAWSKVRSAITQATPRYSGRLYLESWILRDSPIYDKVVAEFGYGTNACLDGAKQIVIQRQGDGSYRTYINMVVSEDFTRNTVDLSNIKATRDFLLSDQFFAGWAEQFKDIIRQLDNFRAWPLYYLPAETLEWKSVSGITLMGDAAHLTIPSGEGVNQAMLDAVELASKLADYGIEQVDRAVREFEESMLVRGREHLDESFRTNDLLAHEDGPEAFLQVMEAHRSSES